MKRNEMNTNEGKQKKNTHTTQTSECEAILSAKTIAD